MVIIDTYFQLLEKDTTKVSGLWKGLQTLGYGTAGITGIIAVISFYNLLSAFSMNCILYPNISFKPLSSYDTHLLRKATNDSGPNVTINALLTSWHSDFICQFCISVWMMSFVGGLILGSFFLLNPKGGKGHPHSLFSQPWKLVIPMFAVTFIMVILTGISSNKAFGGINQFCAAFSNYTNTNSCDTQIDAFSLKYNRKKQYVNHMQGIVKASSILTFFAWLACALLLIIRLCLAPDFSLQVIILEPRRSTETKKMLSQPSDMTMLPPKLTVINMIEEEKRRKKGDPKNVTLGLLKML
ncbi:hypothetical protein Trydic_g4302 [Trypoxylus dichotomus]